MRKLICIFLCFFPFITSAQNLKRKGSLGVGIYENVPDSLAPKLNLPDKNGALIMSVFPNTTAEILKIQPNDFITNVNDKKINSRVDLVLMAKQFRADDALTITLIRNQKKLTLKGKVIGKPIEKNTDEAEVIYDEFPFEKGFVRAIIKRPKIKKNAGTVYFLQGISCYSMDNFQPNDPTKNIIDGLVKNGFTVFRVEKSGIGDNMNTTPCEETGFHQEVSLYREGYKKLLTYKDIDKNNIFLFGHSLGGIAAPILAQEFRPKGVMVYGTGFKPWHDYLLDVYKIQNQMFGADLAQLEDSLTMMKPTMMELFYNKKSAKELAQNPKHLIALENMLYYDKRTGLCIAGRTPQFHVEINENNVAKAWKNTKSYVLAVYGEADLAANNADGHKELVDYVNKYRPNTATFLFIPRTNHSIQEIGTMNDYIIMQVNPKAYEKHAAENFNWKAIDQMAEWAKDKLNK